MIQFLGKVEENYKIKEELTAAPVNNYQKILKRFISNFKVWSGDENIKSENIKPLLESQKGLTDYYKPLTCYEDNRYIRLRESVELLANYQKASASYVFSRNDLASEYLLKARYREDKENFYNSFNLEPQLL